MISRYRLTFPHLLPISPYLKDAYWVLAETDLLTSNAPFEADLLVSSMLFSYEKAFQYFRYCQGKSNIHVMCWGPTGHAG